MSSFRIRPRFSHVVDLTLDGTRDRILEALKPASGIEVKDFPGYICLRIAAKDQHFWSPRLALNLQATPEGTTLVEGIYGPNANVWSLYLFSYLIVGSLALFSGIFGFAQLAIHDRPWGLWVFGTMVVLAIALYVSAQLGQKLGAWQTFQLHQAYQTAIGRPTEIS